jgi:hypothetical protein
MTITCLKDLIKGQTANIKSWTFSRKDHFVDKKYLMDDAFLSPKLSRSTPPPQVQQNRVLIWCRKLHRLCTLPRMYVHLYVPTYTGTQFKKSNIMHPLSILHYCRKSIIRHHFHRQCLVTGLPDFSRYSIPKREKIYQMATKDTK